MFNPFNKNSELPVFLRKGRIGGFLTIVLAGQLTYSALSLIHI